MSRLGRGEDNYEGLKMMSVSGGSQGGGTNDHSLLTDLNADDHLQYASADGSGTRVAYQAVRVTTRDSSITSDGSGVGVNLNTNSGMTISSGLQLGTPSSITSISTNSVTTSTHTHAIDSTLARSAITITSGAGLTGGGDLSANRTIDVGAGTLITVAADSIGITSGAADYGYIGSSTTPWTATWRSISTLAGAGLTHTAGVLDVVTADTSLTINADSMQVRLASTSGLQISSGLMLADTVAGVGLTITSKVIAIGTPTTLTVATTNSVSGTTHSHAITSSSAPGAAASLLASDSSGDLTLQHLKLASTTNQIILQSGGVTGTLTWTPTSSGKTITLPDLTGTISLGAGSLTASSTNDFTVVNHTHAIDSTIARAAITITAGAGLTGGGDLSANRTIDVATADTSMTINADSIQVRLAATSGLQISTGLMLADAVAGAGLTITSKVIAVGTPTTLTVSTTNSVSGTTHSHAITSSSNPGAAASLLASDASGQLTLVNLLANTTTFALVNTTATTVNFAGAATALNMGAATGTTTINNATLALGASAITSTQTTVALLNTTVTTLNFAGASTTINMGAAGATVNLGATANVVFGTDAAINRKAANVLAFGAGDAVQSASFTSGLTGWAINDTGNAEFNNISARGEMRTSVFTVGEIHAVGGTAMILSAGNLYAAVTTATAYTISDSFTTNLAAGAVNGTAAEPGGGTRVVVDTNSRLSIASNKITIAAGSAVTGLWYAQQTRQAGLAILGTYNFTTAGSLSMGWDSDQTASTSPIATIYQNSGGGGGLSIRDNSSGKAVGANLSSGTDYQMAVVLRSTGAWYFIKGGIYTNWSLVWVSSAGTANLYPTIQDEGNTGVATFDDFRIPTQLYIPAPCAYDTFARANSAVTLTSTETSGPDSQIISALAYTAQVGTWGISTNAAYCPTLSGGNGFATVNSLCADAIIDVAVTRAGGVAGIVARWQDTSNYLIAYHDGTNAKLDKVVAGVTTNLISAAATYSAGAVLRLIIDGTNGLLYYNNVKVALGVVTVPASTYTLHGLYSTNTSNTFDNLTIWPRGTNNEHRWLGSLQDGSGAQIQVKDSPTGHLPLFAAGDILRLKAFTGSAVVDNWLRVDNAINTSNGVTYYTYNVSLMNGSSATFPAGAAVVDYGASGSSWISLSSDGTIGSAPNISMGTHAGSPWSTTTLLTRLGNLNGAYGYVVNTYGVGFGSYGVAGQTSITLDTTNGLRIINNVTTIGQWDGSGNITVGAVGASLSNVYITAGAVQLRTNTTVNLSLDTSGNIVVGTVANSLSRVEITAGAVNFISRSGGGVDTTQMSMSTAGVITIGAVGASLSNILITAGAAQFRTNTTVNMQLDTSGKVIVGQVANSQSRVEVSAGAISIIARSAGAVDATYFSVDTSGNVTLGVVGASKGNAYWNTSNNRLEFRGNTTVQAYVDTDGSISAGGGDVTLNSTGISIAATSATGTTHGVHWFNGGVNISRVLTTYAGTNAQIVIEALSKTATESATVVIETTNITGTVQAFFNLTSNGSSTSRAQLYSSAGTFDGLVIGALDTPAAMLDVRGSSIITGGLNIGSATGAGTGEIKVQQDTLGNAVQTYISTATNDDPTENIYQNRAATTDATVTTLHTVTVAASTTCVIEAVITARRTGGSSGAPNDSAGYVVYAVIKCNSTPTTAIVGSATTTVLGESQAGWDATIDVTGATARVRITGALNNNVTWHCTVRVWNLGS